MGRNIVQKKNYTRQGDRTSPSANILIGRRFPAQTSRPQLMNAYFIFLSPGEWPSPIAGRNKYLPALCGAAGVL